jgi:hypothetical protein
LVKVPLPIHPRAELAEEADVVLAEEAQVGDAVAHDGDTLKPKLGFTED